MGISGRKVFYDLERPFLPLGLIQMGAPPRPRKMKTARNENHNLTKGARTMLLGVALLIAGSAMVAGVAFGSTTSFNNVQIFVTTAAQLPYSYTFGAYNLTGSLVASYQGGFAAAAFELPSGEYLFTVSAVDQTRYCNLCAQPMGASTVTASGSSSGSAYPVKYSQPTSEYGWKVANVSSSTSFNIETKNVTTFPTTNMTIKASFVNGTAAAGAWVSANVVGQWYYWWGQNTGVVMSAQTGSDGVAKLVVPVAPTVVTAWDWVPVNLPNSQTTVVVDVGGQKVNVTVFWQPTYVGLSASALLIPPANSANLTLRYQQPNYWYLPPGTGYASTPPSQTGATVANQPSGVPSQVNQMRTASSQTGQSQYYLPSQIPSLHEQAAPSGSSTSPSGGFGLAWEAAAAAMGVFAALAVTLVVLGRRQHPPGAI